VEHSVQMVRGTRSAFAERAVSGYYLDIDIDRGRGAPRIQRRRHPDGDRDRDRRHDDHADGRGTRALRRALRYPQELRDTPERLAAVLVPVSHTRGGSAEASARSSMGGMVGGATGGSAMSGSVAQVPLGQVATIRQVAGPMVVRTEDALPTAWVYIDVEDRDIGSYVAEAREMVEQEVTLPPGYTLVWSGEYEYMERAKQKMQLVIPATLAIIFLLLYFNFRSMGEAMIVMLSMPFALVGGVWFIWMLDYNWSVSVAIGFLALAGVAAETGVVMLIYLNHAWKARTVRGRAPTLRDLSRPSSKAPWSGCGRR
jgi:copper/silver efflux system protein